MSIYLEQRILYDHGHVGIFNLDIKVRKIFRADSKIQWGKKLHRPTRVDKYGMGSHPDMFLSLNQLISNDI